MLIGREAERARIDELIARARRGRSGSLVVLGDAGQGKTALLDYAAEQARGMTVVRAVGVEAEAELEFAGLLELVRPLFGHLQELPAAQADALRAVLGMGAAASLDRFVVGAATLSLLATAAESTPLLAVVDDAHWLDRPTIDALRFAAKRLEADAVVVLLGARPDERVDLAGIEQLELGPLAAPDAERLLAAGPARPVPAVARRLWQATGGNPLALIEIQGLLDPAQLEGREPLPEPLPAGATLERVFASRLTALPPAARTAVLLAALSIADEEGVVTVVAACRSLGIPGDALEPAERAGLVTLVGGRVAFRHPLVRSAVFHSASAAERRSGHRALAATPSSLADAERRAWHLAGAAPGHDDEAANALEAAAHEATRRSGHAAAAAALTRSAELTADAATRRRRLSEAAQASIAAGRLDDAVTLLAEPLGASDGGRARAEALRLRARIAYMRGEPERTSELLFEASELLEHVDRRLATAVAAESCSTLQIVGSAPRLLRLAERVHDLAKTSGDENAERLGAFTLGWALCYSGRLGEGIPLVEANASTLDRGGASPDPLDVLRASLALDWLDRSDDAFRLAGGAVDELRARSAVGPLPYVLLQQAWHAVRAGLLDEAHAAAAEALELSREADVLLPHMQSLLVLASVWARRGLPDECHRAAEEVAPLGERAGAPVFRIWRLYSLGILALALGRWADAERDLGDAAGGLEELELHSPSFVARAELVEVHVRAGHTERAVAALRRFEASPEPLSPLGLAAGARARGLLEADEFEACFADAFAAHARSDDRWSLARTQLAYGERLRRAGRRVAAREQLGHARDTFAAMGAAGWLARAEAELRASGQRLRRHRGDGPEVLTAQELRIALHVARGLTNREVGAALFLSPRTVEFHLGRIYRKLDIRSRADVIARYAQIAQDVERVTV